MKRANHNGYWLAWFFAGMVAIMLSGCAALGVPEADTFNKKAAAAYATIDVIGKSVSSMQSANKMTTPEARRYLARLDQMVQAVDLAVQMQRVAPADADQRLAGVIAALTLIQSQLQPKVAAATAASAPMQGASQ